jgi:type IV pilus assembly protein PilN
MRLDINLASRPYEDVGEFYRTWGALAGFVAVVTLVLLGLTVSSLTSARTVGEQTAKLRSQMAAFDQQRRAAEDLLNRPENRETRDRSRFLNALIARKAFSWTQVFADLEKIVPARVHVLSIKPGLTEDNQFQVEMQVATDSRDRMVELVRRLEESKTFHQAQVRSESAQNTPTGGHTVEFDLVALYTPHVPPAAPQETPQAAHGGAQ